MGDVVSLRAKKEEDSPHLSGKAKCLSCAHEWVAVAPAGVTWMECPSCSLMRGRFINGCEKEEEHWHCFCGNNLFFVTKDGYYCGNCGIDQTGF